MFSIANTEGQRNSKNNESWKGQGRGENKNQNNGKQCSYRHKLYHIVDECYAKHDYPSWYNTKSEKVINNIVLTLWQVYQFVRSSKMEVQVSFSQGICVCLSNCNYLLILAMMTTLMVDLIHKINKQNYWTLKLWNNLGKTSLRLDFMNHNNAIFPIQYLYLAQTSTL